MIRYLEQEEKILTKPLYQEAFFEDSAGFVKYYYSEKIKDNRILADIEESVKSMIMLNPYTISVFNKKYCLDYIVAVATKKEYKRHGYMRRLLDKTLIDMNEIKVPFTYLIPANKDYYLPFDFAFVARKNEYNADLSDYKKSVISGVKLDIGVAEKILDFINTEISKSNDVYTYRDMHYFDRELKEISSENGFINIYLDGDDIVAYESFWGIEKVELKERIVASDIATREYGKENIMVRITDVAELLSNFRASKNIDIIVKINDNIIESQNAFFRIEMGKDFAKIGKILNKEGSAFVEFAIADFTAWIFGYAGDVKYNIVNFTDKSIAKDSLDSIKKIGGIFINELV
jgi:hypothetical protein